MCTKKEHTQQLERYASKFAEAITNYDFGNGLSIAYSGYSLACEVKDSQATEQFLRFINLAAKELLKPEGEQCLSKTARSKEVICSFCLLETDNLVQGLNVAICSKCLKKALASLSK
jgi:hypothetical protein